jgi:hypothetical protein
MFKVTRPGGWCQMVELYFQCQSDNGTLSESITISRNDSVNTLLLTSRQIMRSDNGAPDTLRVSPISKTYALFIDFQVS